MRGNGDLLRAGAVQIIKVTALRTERGEVLVHEWIVNELTKYGERSTLSGRVGGTQGVADAEAHAVMLSEDDVHGVLALCDKVNG